MADFGKVFVQSMTNALTMSQRDNEFKTQFALEEMKAEREGKHQEFQAQKLLDQIASEDKFRLKLLDNAATTESRQELKDQRDTFEREFSLVTPEEAERYKVPFQPIESLQSRYPRLPLNEMKGRFVTDAKNADDIRGYKAYEWQVKRDEDKGNRLLKQIADINRRAAKVGQPKYDEVDVPVYPSFGETLWQGVKNIGYMFGETDEKPKSALGQTRKGYAPNVGKMYKTLDRLAPLVQEAENLNAANQDKLRPAFGGLINRFANLAYSVQQDINGKLLFDETKVSPLTAQLAVQKLNEIQAQQAQQEYEIIKDDYQAKVKVDKSGADSEYGKAIKAWKEKYGDAILQNLGSTSVRSFNPVITK